MNFPCDHEVHTERTCLLGNRQHKYDGNLAHPNQLKGTQIQVRHGELCECSEMNNCSGKGILVSQPTVEALPCQENMETTRVQEGEDTDVHPVFLLAENVPPAEVERSLLDSPRLEMGWGLPRLEAGINS